MRQDVNMYQAKRFKRRLEDKLHSLENLGFETPKFIVFQPSSQWLMDMIGSFPRLITMTIVWRHDCIKYPRNLLTETRSRSINLLPCHQYSIQDIMTRPGPTGKTYSDKGIVKARDSCRIFCHTEIHIARIRSGDFQVFVFELASVMFKKRVVCKCLAIFEWRNVRGIKLL